MFQVRTARRNGFTLIDLLVALALLGFLAGLFLGLAVPTVRKAAASSQCQNNLKQLALALHNSHSVYGKFPPLVGPYPENDLKNTNGTLHFYLLPYLEQDNLYKLSLDDKGNSFVWNRKVWSTTNPVFLCPQDPNPPKNNLYQDWLATTNYAGNWLVFGQRGKKLFTITDGTSNTIAFTERYQMCKGNPCGWGYPGLYYWMPAFAYYSQGKFQQRPGQEQCDPALPQGFHAGGINVAMADGSARQVSQAISPQTWWYACTPAGGEPFPDDWE